MSINNNRLKNILTTASIAAVIFGYSDSIFAAEARVAIGNAAFLRTGVMLDNNGGGNAPFTADSTIQLSVDGDITSNTVGGINIRAIDAKGFAGNLFITKNTGSGSIIDSTGGAGVIKPVISAGIEYKIYGSGSIASGNAGALDDLAGAATLAAFAANANDYSALGDINFAGLGAELTVDNSALVGGPDAAKAGKAITLTGAFLNPADGMLNVITPLIATDASVAEIASINVGTAGNASSFTIDGGIATSAGNIINLLDGGNLIALRDAGSILKLTNSEAVEPFATFNLKKDFDPSGGAGAGPAIGIVELNANATTGQLFLQGEAGGETLGTAANPLTELRITGDQVVVVNGPGGGGANEVDLTNIKLLNVQNSAGFYAETATVAAIPKINIGMAESLPGAGDAIDGLFILDSVDANLLANAGDEIKFLTADSALKIVNTAVAAGTTVTLQNTLSVAVDETGIVKLYADGGGGGALTIADKPAGGSKLGTSDVLRLKELELSGDKDINVNVEIFAKKITLDDVGKANFGKKIKAGADSLLEFNEDKEVTFADDVEVKTIDFNGKDGTIEIAVGKKLTATLDSTGAVKGKVKFAGAGELIGVVDAKGVAIVGAIGIAEVKADGVATVLKVTGKHKITELTGTNASTIEFADGAELVGGINTLSGGAVKLVLSHV